MHELNPLVSVITPEDIGADLLTWVASKKSYLNEKILCNPALLFRGFNTSTEKSLLDFSSAFSPSMDYVYRSTPRTQLDQGIYTATEYPNNLTIPQHCENAYQKTWPLRVYFHCLQPSNQGGETPLSDVRKVTSSIPVEIQEKFKEYGVKYVRNYKPGLDISWETVFQTTSKSDVETYCTNNGIAFEWSGENFLRTEQTCQATASHPSTRDELWFNQAHLFHITNVDKNIQKFLLDMYGEKGLPRNSYYGNGEPIEEEVLQEIRDAYNKHKCEFKWEKNDILMVDNMLCSHGRNPFTGDRKVLVSMNTPVTST